MLHRCVGALCLPPTGFCWLVCVKDPAKAGMRACVTLRVSAYVSCGARDRSNNRGRARFILVDTVGINTRETVRGTFFTASSLIDCSNGMVIPSKMPAANRGVTAAVTESVKIFVRLYVNASSSI